MTHPALGMWVTWQDARQDGPTSAGRQCVAPGRFAIHPNHAADGCRLIHPVA